MQSPNDKQHLRILTDELGTAPPQVPRKENRTIELNLYSRWETPVQDIQSALMDSVSSSDMLYMETKSIFVQLIRSIPHVADKRPYNLAAIAERAATTKDATLVRKGIKVKEMLRELEEQKIVEQTDGYKLMQEEVAAELVHLGNLREKVILETKSLEAVYKTICDHNNYMRSQLEQYKAYLQNVRLSASKEKGSMNGVGVVTVGGKEKKPTKAVVLGPYRFTHAQLEKEGIIVESNVPDNRYITRFSCVRFVLTHVSTVVQTSTSTLHRRLLGLLSSLYITRVARRPSSKWISKSTICWRRCVSVMPFVIRRLNPSFPPCSKRITSIYWIWNMSSLMFLKSWAYSRKFLPNDKKGIGIRRHRSIYNLPPFVLSLAASFLSFRS
jgi:hypothetical protein